MAAAGLTLAACFENVSISQLTGQQPANAGPSVIAVLGGQMSVTGPQGYCVDQSATRESTTEAFVLLVRCSAGRSAVPVLSASVTGITAPAGDDPGTLERLAEFVASETGRGQLARSGDADDVRIDTMRVEDGALWLRIEDRGNPEAFEAGYWRAILPIAERVVTLSVLSARANPVDSDRGLQVLRTFVSRMRTQNPD